MNVDGTSNSSNRVRKDNGHGAFRHLFPAKEKEKMEVAKKVVENMPTNIQTVNAKNIDVDLFLSGMYGAKKGG